MNLRMPVCIAPDVLAVVDGAMVNALIVCVLELSQVSV